MKRRYFLQKLSLGFGAMSSLYFLKRRAKIDGNSLAIQGESRKILVVIELSGGCDGLNTVVPYGLDDYYRARPNLSISPADVLKLDQIMGFHPSLEGLKNLYDQGKLALIQGVGYPNPNRFHLRSRDIWHTARPGEIFADGWLARYLRTNGQRSLSQGINIGGSVPGALTLSASFRPTIQSIDGYGMEADERGNGYVWNKNAVCQQLLSMFPSSYLLGECVNQNMLNTISTSVQLTKERGNYQNKIEYPDNLFAASLKTISQIIAANIGVRVLYTSIGGFDTHASQVALGDTTQGTHANLLSALSTGLTAFQTDLVEQGLADNVLIMTFSEFGRHLAENTSGGTDHGTANQMFIIGNGVKPGLYGYHPGLSLAARDPMGDMVYTVDFRSVYATVLENWLGADSLSLVGNQPLMDFV